MQREDGSLCRYVVVLKRDRAEKQNMASSFMHCSVCIRLCQAAVRLPDCGGDDEEDIKEKESRTVRNMSLRERE